MLPCDPGPATSAPLLPARPRDGVGFAQGVQHGAPAVAGLCWHSREPRSSPAQPAEPGEPVVM